MTIYTLDDLRKALVGSPFKLHGRTEFQGLPISIENRKGSKRQWGPRPEQHTVMKFPYGYIRGAEGYDGDEVDVYIGPNKKSPWVFIINQRQRRSLGKFDEHKVMLGFESLDEAKRAYCEHFSPGLGERLLGSIRMWTIDRFKKWIANGKAKDGPIQKSLSEVGELVLEKAAPAGGGWSPIPKGKKGGYRRRTRDGWDYWYPEGTAPKKLPPKLRLDPAPDFERISPERVTEYKKKLRTLSAEYRELMDSWNPEIGWRLGWDDEKRASEESAAHARYMDLKRKVVSLQSDIVGLMMRVGGDGSGRLSEFNKTAPKRMQQAAWNLQSAPDALLPARYHGDGKRTGEFTPNEKKIKNRLAKTQRLFREALVELDVTLKERGGPLLAAREQFESHGFRFEVTEDSKGIRESAEFEGFLSRLSRVREKLKRRGLEKASDGLLIRFADHSPQGIWVAGEYSIPRDSLTMYSFALGIGDSTQDTREDMRTEYGTFVHELGHRVFYRTLTSVAREQWRKTYQDMREPLTKEHIDSYIDDWRAAKKMEAEDNYGMTAYSFMTKKFGYRGYPDDPPHPDQHKQYLHDKLPFNFQEKTEAEIRAHFEPRLSHATAPGRGQPGADEGTLLFAEPLTEYGTANADEAFAEAFRLYVDHGPGAIGPRWRRALEDALASGGMKLRKSLLVIPLKKAGHAPAGGGWQPILRGRKGGYRRSNGKGGWDYWYPQTTTVKRLAEKKTTFPWGESEWSEEQFEASTFDTDPANWQPYHVRPGQPSIPWTAGGVVPTSKHPVKETGLPHRLYQIVDAHHDAGWALLRDVNTGETRQVAHDRILPVYHGQPPKPARQAQTTQPTTQGEPWDPESGEDGAGSPTGTSEDARRIAPFKGSTAPEGSGIATLEAGVLLRQRTTVWVTDASGQPRKAVREKTHVDSLVKEKVIAELGPMLSRVAMEAKKRFGLRSRYSESAVGRRVDDTLIDLRMSAIEGALVAMERYEGGGPFRALAKQYAKGYVAIHAAREFGGGLALPKRVQRMLSGFIAAKVRARDAFGTDNPTPKQIAAVWDVRKWQLHSGLTKDDPQYNEPVPIKPYKLKSKEKTADGKLRTKATDTKTQLGKLAWAERIHSFLEGQSSARGSDFFEDDTIAFPNVLTGSGLSAQQRVEIRASVAKVLPDLEQHVITVTSGRVSTTYRADSATLLSRRLGLAGDDEMSTRDLASSTKIERKTEKGWVTLSERARADVVPVFLERALEHLKSKLDESGDEAAATLIGSAAQRIAPDEHARPGIAYRDLLNVRARDVTPAQIAAWRVRARKRFGALANRMRNRAATATDAATQRQAHDAADALLRAQKRIDKMGRREVALHIAQAQSSATSDTIRKMQTATVEVDHQSPGTEYGWTVTTITDPETGEQRRVRMRTFREEAPRPAGSPLKKALDSDPLDEQALLLLLQWPRLTALLWGRDPIPTEERFQLEALVGMH